MLPQIIRGLSTAVGPTIDIYKKRKRIKMGEAELIDPKKLTYSGAGAAGSGAAGSAGSAGTKGGLLSNIFNKRNLTLLGLGYGANSLINSGNEPTQPFSPPPRIPDPEKNVDPRLLQVLFPNIGGKATNKELINAAILRASLEMLKPRATNENFASSAQRAITAGATVGSQNIGIYPSARAARQAGESEGFDEIEVYQKDTGWAYKGTSIGFSTSDGGTETSTLPMVETAEDLAKLAPGSSYSFVDENGVTRTGVRGEQ